MQILKTVLQWIAIAAAFFVVVGLLTMTADKPPEDPKTSKNTPAAAPK